MAVLYVGIDLAKSVFAVHDAADAALGVEAAQSPFDPPRLTITRTT